MTPETRQTPSFVVPPYQRLCSLIAAAHISPPDDPPGYNEVRRGLMLRFFKRKTVPTPTEFAEATEELYRVLDDAGWPHGRWVGHAHGDALMAAKLRLDAAVSEAAECGLTDGEGDEPSADRRRSRRRHERGDRGGWQGPAR